MTDPAIPGAPGAGIDEGVRARTFLSDAAARMLRLTVDAQRAEWVYETYITPDTAEITARAEAVLSQTHTRLATEAATYRSATLLPGERRQLDLIVLARAELPPREPRLAEEMSQVSAEMRGHYGAAKCILPDRAKPLDLNEIRKIFTESRDPDLLRRVWVGWHDAARPLRDRYARFVVLANQGARELGFADTGEMWRAKYDMPAEEFAREVERLWSQVRPLYLLLHAWIRRRLRNLYGDALVARDAAIPAHLLGELWAQVWAAVLPSIAPPSLGAPFDLTAALQARNTSPRGLVEYGEGFFRSLGFDPLPATFWERSMLTRPSDREVLCHASAWDVDYDDDVRLKVCLDVTADDFEIVHHELGHTFYQRAYRHQPFFFREGANDGFHEAIGDAVGLSVTPAYFQQVGLAAPGNRPESDLLVLLRRALEKVAFLPSALAIDVWRWRVFDGSVGPEEYSTSWWELRKQYGGVTPPVDRPPDSFDPGAKMHVPANVPYMRYFLARILQFQFHRAFARQAGHKGPLHEFSAYGKPEAGRRFREMLELGASRPWPEALAVLTGETRMDGAALLEYFAPLEQWLREEAKGEEVVGW